MTENWKTIRERKVVQCTNYRSCYIKWANNSSFREHFHFIFDFFIHY